MAAFGAGGHLVHALEQQHGIAVNLEGSAPCAKCVEPQAARADCREEHWLGRAHATIVDADKVIGVQSSDGSCIRPNERDPEGVVDGANALADDIGAAWGARSALGVASVDSADAE
jgi:hypothetical protein